MTKASDAVSAGEGSVDRRGLDAGTEVVGQIYDRRFTNADAARKRAIWAEIGRYLQRFVPRDGAVLDLACDRGDFIASVEAREKWATDVRDVSASLPLGVTFVRADGLELRDHLPLGHFDTVFMSNYLEHLPSSSAVIAQLEVARDLLRSGGHVVVLQPNIRLTGPAYWDFIDHRVPLTEKSLVEAAETVDLETERVIARFLPYTTKSRFPQSPSLVRAYLALRPMWLLLGKQTLYVGRKA